ncbi:hypothetical protein ACROYT_G016188 [Oculina patagonica]
MSTALQSKISLRTKISQRFQESDALQPDWSANDQRCNQRSISSYAQMETPLVKAATCGDYESYVLKLSHYSYAQMKTLLVKAGDDYEFRISESSSLLKHYTANNDVETESLPRDL